MDKLESITKEIEDTQKQIVALEAEYEKEEDETNSLKLETRLDRADKKLDKFVAQADAMRKDKLKETPKEDVDEDVCPECGSDLYDIGEGLLFCEKCNEYYEDEEKGEENE